MQKDLTYRLSLAWIIAWTGAAAAVQQIGVSYELPNRLMPPALGHLLGFDAFGRDLLILTLRASMASLLFAGAATLVTTLVALMAGCGIALLPKSAQFVFLRVVEGFLAFPSLLFALLLAVVLGPGWTTLGWALLIGMAPSQIRLVYVRARELLLEDYIKAAESLGSPPLAMIRKHLLPAAFALSAVKTPNLFAHALIAEATLTFLGIGAPYGQDTWGSLLAQGREYLIEAPHIAIGSGLPLVLMALSLQLCAERWSSNRTRL